MDSSAFRHLNLGGLFWWAIFGMGAAAVSALVFLIWLVWFVVNHVQIV